MHLVAKPEAVFPLLCPVREYEWIETWSCEVVYTRSGVAELDCVFRTSFAADGPDDTWVVSRYEPPSRIEFVRVNGLRSMRYVIELSPHGESGTRATWSQVLTGLNADGDRLLEAQSDQAFSERLSGIERMLNHFLATGERLSLKSE